MPAVGGGDSTGAVLFFPERDDPYPCVTIEDARFRTGLGDPVELWDGCIVGVRLAADRYDMRWPQKYTLTVGEARVRAELLSLVASCRIVEIGVDDDQGPTAA